MKKPEVPMLKEVFQQLKQADEHSAPSFVATWAAAHARLAARGQTVPLQWRSGWIWVAAVLLIAGSSLFYRALQHDAQADHPLLTAPPLIRYETPGPRVSVTAKLRRTVRASRLSRRHSPRRSLPVVQEVILAVEPESEDKTDFIPLRYGEDLPPMECGKVIRVQLSRASLITLGLPVTAERADEAIKADLLLGEDGQARAVRFVR